MENVAHFQKKQSTPKAQEAVSILRAVIREIQYPSRIISPPIRADEIDLATLGATLINVLEEPAYSQVPLRNMFEIAFDGMERATQRERFKLLTDTYPSVVNRHFPARRMIEPDGDIPLSSARMEYRVESLDDLHELLLSLYFAQKKQRIVRCECCWGYFIPSSTRPARFCDQVFEGKSCKNIGPRMKHSVSLDQDEALRVYDALRHRMTVRQELLYGGNLGQVNHIALSKWDEAARAARKAYLNGEITAEDFLRRIDLFHDLDSYDVNAPKPSEKSLWRKLIEQNIRFDPYRELSDMMVLDLNADNPKWEVISSEERTREVQQGHQSLQALYRNK